MRQQVPLLGFLVRMWDVNGQFLCVGPHTLSIEIEDVYFLMGLSNRG